MAESVEFNRRRTLQALMALGGASLAPAAMAQGDASWPQKPIKIVVPVAAGGIIDLLGRAVAKAISPVLKQPVVVESRAGADHIIGAQYVDRSEADGYTWLFASVPFTVSPVLRKDAGYDPKAFKPLALIASSPNVLVVPTSVPAKNVAEFVALAKAKPGELAYANPGTGSSNHLGMELFKSEAGIDLLAVPYNGQPPAITDLLAGRVQAMLISSSLVAAHVKTGALRPLASIAQERLPALPDVPTIKEAGYPKADVIPWFGLMAPSKTPDAVVAKAASVLNEALTTQGLKNDIAGIGATPSPPGSPAEFSAFIERDLAKWPAVLKRAGIERK